jgi:membrane protease YdiL (CAAX protease family)
LQRVLDNKPAVTLLVLLIAGMAPVCEELFFRGVIFGSARAAGLNNVGVALSAVLFASVHVSLLLAPFYLIFAVVMCWLYARTGTLAAPIAAHATLNSVACAALIFAGNRV